MDTSSDSAPAAAATPEVDAANVAPAQYPNMDVAQKVFTATRPGAPASAREEAVALMRADSMAETYAEACAAHGWESDAALLAAMRAANAKEAERLSAALEDAKVNHGDMEVLDALVEIARLHARTGAKQAAYDALAAVVAFSKVSTGKKIEMTLDRARVGFFYNDVAGVKAALAHADKLVEDGGDWDQRNRLKVYTATLAVMQRDFKTAAGLFLECIATFTCSELFSCVCPSVDGVSRRGQSSAQSSSYLKMNCSYLPSRAQCSELFRTAPTPPPPALDSPPPPSDTSSSSSSRWSPTSSTWPGPA